MNKFRALADANRDQDRRELMAGEIVGLRRVLPGLCNPDT
jgi:hypothetical protein